MDDDPWERAACRGLSLYDPKKWDKIFFPSKGRPRNDKPYLKYCTNCRIKGFCLSYGLVYEEDGIWGGLTRAERDSLPFSIKNDIKQTAKEQGWYHPRISIDELLQLTAVGGTSIVATFVWDTPIADFVL